MERELQEYYENRFTTMATQGWINIIEDAQDLFDVYNKINTTMKHIKLFESFKLARPR